MSIKVTNNLKDVLNQVKSRRDAIKGQSHKGIVFTEVHYAAAVEYGTSRRPATPYFRPAIEPTQAYIQKRFSAATSLNQIKDIKNDGLAFFHSFATRITPVDTGNLVGSLTIGEFD